MRNLFTFILRNYFFFLFLLLESISIYLVIQNNYYHSSVMFKSANAITGNVLKTVNSVKEYFYLREVNRHLAEENARLHALTRKAYILTDRNVFYQNDTLFRRQYSFVNARIISSSTNKRANYLMIDKGRLQGIEPDMGVMAPNGVVGIVAEVSNNFSKVISVLHKDSRISAKLKNSDYRGFVIWEGLNPRQGTLIDLPAYVSVQKGDTILTSGNSLIFPEDVMIGTIEEAYVDKGDNYYKIKLNFTVDYHNITHVHVIGNLYRSEQVKMEESGK
jgi:rod shape-determining protein MreC